MPLSVLSHHCLEARGDKSPDLESRNIAGKHSLFFTSLHPTNHHRSFALSFFYILYNQLISYRKVHLF
ncbi:putative racemase YgeA [Fusarium oxysporum f. sp. albedinis]|nr:putative racemase YgeA [Fusarium oxysporum f. sp. albedinis]